MSNDQLAINIESLNSLFRHAGPEEPAPYLMRGHPGEGLDVLARFGSLRLPSVARPSPE